MITNRQIINMKRICFCLLSLFFFLNVTLSYAFETNTQPIHCNILINSEKEVASSLIETNVFVEIDNNELRQDQLYLSYHLLSDDGNLLYYEGERIKISTWNSDGLAVVPVTIDIYNYGNISPKQNIIIQFDIVDESKSFWFSMNPDIQLNNDSLNYKGGFVPKIMDSFQKALQHPIAIFINLVSLVMINYILVKLKQNDFELI